MDFHYILYDILVPLRINPNTFDDPLILLILLRLPCLVKFVIVIGRIAIRFLFRHQ